MLYLLTSFPISYNLNAQLTNSMVSFFDLLNRGSITYNTWGASTYYKNYMIILQSGIPLFIICPHTARKIAQKMGVALCHEKVGCACSTTNTTANNNIIACSKGGGGGAGEGEGGGREVEGGGEQQHF